MKICVTGLRGFPGVQGGIEKHCQDLYPLIKNFGVDVTVIGRRQYIGKNTFDYKGVKVIPLAALKNKNLEAITNTFLGIIKAKLIGAEIIHIHGIGPCLLAPLAKMLGLKVVVTSQGYDYDRKKWGKIAKFMLRLGEKFGCIFSNKYIVVRQDIANFLKIKYNKNSVVIPNGVNVYEPVRDQAILDNYNLETGKYILNVARFVPEKGLQDLIEAFLDIEDTKRYKLLIVGDADHESAYSLHIKELAKKRNDIVLTGVLKENILRTLYSNAGFFVLPSYHEGLPIVLLEAMSYGLNCLASDIDANAAVIGFSQQNYFKTGDIKELSEKLKIFIQNKISDDQKKRQIKYIKDNYNWSNIAKRTFDVYLDLFKKR